MYETIAQVIGIFAAAAMIISYQFKNNRILFLLQGLGGLLFAVNFFMLDNKTAAFFNFVNLFRGAVLAFGGNRLRGWWLGVIFMVIYVVITALTFDGWISVLILIAQLASTVTLWSQNKKWIRVGQMAVISPCWLTNNIAYKSWGGVVTEVFCLVSALISLIRYRKNFTPKKQSRKGRACPTFFLHLPSADGIIKTEF